MAEDQDPLDDELDPSEDTPDSEPEDTDAAETPDPSDPEERLKEAQRKITAQANELALYRRQAAESDEDDEEDDEVATDDRTARFEAESWALAERLYGQEAIDAYGAARKLLRNATTPADFVASFEAYYDMRSNATKEAPATGGTSRAEAMQPKETGREDLGPDLQQAERKLTEARKGNSLADFTAAATAAMGFGRAKS